MLATNPATAPEMWDALTGIYCNLTDQVPQMLAPGVDAMPKMPESTPWLAALLLPAGLLFTTREDLSWMGDFERCLAWALLEEVNEA